jgi:hypothetical protein
LGTGDDDGAAASQGGEGEQDGGGVVVDDQGSFRAGETLEQSFGMHQARAAPAARQVVFEVGVAERDGLDGLQGGGAERGAAEVGVQDNAGGVDDGEEGGGGPLAQQGGGVLQETGLVGDGLGVGGKAGANFVQAGAQGFQGQGAAIGGDQLAGLGGLEQGVNGGEVAESGHE